jgi:Sec-independent protein translocase protein TatA
VPDILLLLIVILIVVVIWRGPKTLPQIGNVLGRGVKAAREEARTIREDANRTPEPEAPAAPTTTTQPAPPEQTPRT